ncbi:MAG: DUF2851 family protein [Dehalococcoidia bacterium]
MSREVNERLLARIWLGQWLNGSRLRTFAGERLQVVFPGRPNGDRGPDLLDAMVSLEEGRLLQGDVELHVRARDWSAHGHHQDPFYNGVVLHVTWSADMPWVEREDRVQVPTVPLKGCTSLPIEELLQLGEAEPPFYTGCRRVAEGLGPERVGGLLDRAGEARFIAKGSCFQEELTCQPVQEVLYQGLMGALGYGKNQEPFHRLAQRLPLSTLEGLTGGMPLSRRPLAISALLLGVAGLLPSQGEGDGMGSFTRAELDGLEKLWRGSLLAQEMEAREWRTFRIRPANHPGSRIMGIGHLLARFLGTGLPEGLGQAVMEVHSAGTPGPLERSIKVSKHLGQGRTREMIVNVVLPFFWALGEYQSHPGLAEACLELFRACPKGRDNHITRQMGLQLYRDGGRGVIDSARRQQGLIHLFKGPCHHGYCPGCPLGRALASAEGEAVAAGYGLAAAG